MGKAFKRIHKGSNIAKTDDKLNKIKFTCILRREGRKALKGLVESRNKNIIRKGGLSGWTVLP